MENLPDLANVAVPFKDDINTPMRMLTIHVHTHIHIYIHAKTMHAHAKHIITRAHTRTEKHIVICIRTNMHTGAHTHQHKNTHSREHMQAYTHKHAHVARTHKH